MFIPTLDHSAAPVSSSSDLPFTEKQGQYLAFIHTYVLLNRQAPAETDFQRFFMVSAPAVHQMIVALERRGWIARVPGRPRSIQLLVSPDRLPALQPIKTTVSGH